MHPMRSRAIDPFEPVRAIGLTLPDVEAATKYDGSPVLKLGGSFLAGLATHPSAEPDTLVVRANREERRHLIEDAPETYYLTDYYRDLSPYPGSSVAGPSRRPARPPLRFLAFDPAQNSNSRPPP